MNTRTAFASSLARNALLTVLAIAALTPFAFIVLTSFMNGKQTLTASFWPSPWTLENYATVTTGVPLAQWAVNSVLYAALSVVFMLLSSVPAAYVLAKVTIPFARTITVLVIFVMVLPPQVSIVPIYAMWAKLGLTGTLWPLIIPNILGDAYSVFLLRQFFLSIPSDYLDAARLDGCSEFRLLWRILVPLARPGLVAVSIFMLTRTWNDYFGPLLFASENSAAWTISFGLANFKGSHGTDWGATMALTVLSIAPVILLFLFAQRSFVRGIALSGIK